MSSLQTSAQAHAEILIERAAEQGAAPTSDPDVTLILRIQSALVDAARSAGFAHDVDEYARAYATVFETLDHLEQLLSGQRFLLGGDAPSAADWWLFAALLRFDPIYYGLYKCNRTRIADYEQLPAYLRDLAQSFAVSDTFDFEATRREHYLESERINPKGTWPLGGDPELWSPHDRATRFAPPDVVTVGTEEDQTAARRQGEWVRKRSAHRERISADGSTEFPGASGRYHLIVANNCPWCHRVALARAIKGLQGAISMDVAFYRRDPERGWQFRPEEPDCTEESLFGFRYVRELYERVGSSEKSVPVLWDRQSESIVSNESAEIIQMLNDAFEPWATDSLDLYPPALRGEIDQINAWTYTDINNGAYKAGFGSGQEAFKIAYERFFAAVERCESILATQDYLAGGAVTLADVRLFPTLFRFDPIYYTRFRLNRFMVRDRPHLSAWMRRMWALPGVQEASNLDHARKGYFGRTGNNIVPLGPDGALGG